VPGSQHRISFGVGVADVMRGIDFELMAGGMFRDTEQLGAFCDHVDRELLDRHRTSGASE